MLAEIQYDGQLSGAAYMILAFMFFLIFGGLAWCFYRAISAADKTADEQLPDEV